MYVIMLLFFNLCFTIYMKVDTEKECINEYDIYMKTIFIILVFVFVSITL